MKDTDVEAMLVELQQDLVREAVAMLVRLGVPLDELRRLVEEGLRDHEDSRERRQD